MPSQRYLKAQRTRWRKVLEEDSKKIKEGLEEVRENGEVEVDLKDLKETVCTNVTRFKETTEKLSMLIDEEGDEEKIKSREKEEEEEFNFLNDVEGLICKVNSTFEKKRPTAKKLIKNQQNTKKEIHQLIQLYFQGEKKMPGQTTHEHKQIERKANKQTNQAINKNKQDNDKPEQTTQELKQIEMKTNKQTNQAINETKQDNDKQSNYEQMNKESNEAMNKPTKKKRKRVKRKTTNQETNDNEISTNGGCTQQINKQEEEINTDERNDEMNRKRKLQCQKGREFESPVGESNKGRKERFQQKNQTNKDDSTDSDNHINKQDDKNSEKEDEETDLYYKLKLVERYKYKLK